MRRSKNIKLYHYMWLSVLPSLPIIHGHIPLPSQEAESKVAVTITGNYTHRLQSHTLSQSQVSALPTYGLHQSYSLHTQTTHNEPTAAARPSSNYTAHPRWRLTCCVISAIRLPTVEAEQSVSVQIAVVVHSWHGSGNNLGYFHSRNWKQSSVHAGNKKFHSCGKQAPLTTLICTQFHTLNSRIKPYRASALRSFEAIENGTNWKPVQISY